MFDLHAIANGDLRHSANAACWEKQRETEDNFFAACARLGIRPHRAHNYDPALGHGLIYNQRQGMDIIAQIPDGARVAVVEAVWCYSHHISVALRNFVEQRGGQVLVVANWDGTWPGLVGAANVHGTLCKHDVPHSMIWGRDMLSDEFIGRLKEWAETGNIVYDEGPATRLCDVSVKDDEAADLGAVLAAHQRRHGVVLGYFDEACMGMDNGVFSGSWLGPAGLGKENLSQSALYYEACNVSDDEAFAVYTWLLRAGVKFHYGTNYDTDLTLSQVLQQCRMYIAALRIADDFGCSVIGIQYQQGLKDLMPASDLAEGMLNSSNRPPVYSRDGLRLLYEGGPLPCANEVDGGNFVDAALTMAVQRALKQPVATTQQDVRWGDWDQSGTVKDFVWVYLLSGSNPADHFIGGWRGVESFRQPPMYFPLGGGTMRGICKPGELVFSRVYEINGKGYLDLWRGQVVRLPIEETQRRWNATTTQWPIAHAVHYGLGNDEVQFFAGHKSNHAMQTYCTSAATADKALLTRAHMAENLGLTVRIRGTRKNGVPW